MGSAARGPQSIFSDLQTEAIKTSPKLPGTSYSRDLDGEPRVTGGGQEEQAEPRGGVQGQPVTSSVARKSTWLPSDKKSESGGERAGP